MSGGGQQQTSFQRSDPWDPAQPALRTALQGAQEAYDTTYRGPQVAARDPLLDFGNEIQRQNAFSGRLGGLGQLGIGNLTQIMSNGGLSGEQSGALAGLGKSMDGFNAANDKAMGYLDPYASGAMRGSNPYLKSAVDNAMSDAAAATNRQFTAAGRYGSGAQADALGSRLGKIATDAYTGAYESDSNRQLQAIGQMGSLNSAGLQGNLAGRGAMADLGQQRINNITGIAQAMPALNLAQNIDAATLQGLGSGNMAYAQSLIDANNSAPWSRVGNLAQIAGGIGGLGGTQQGVSTRQNTGGMPVLGAGLGILGGFSNLFTGGAGSAFNGIRGLFSGAQ